MVNPQCFSNLPAKPELYLHWPLTDITKVCRKDAPLSAKRAVEHLFKARSAKLKGEIEISLKEYKKSLVFWFEADTQQPGRWANALRYTNMEYALLMLGR